MDHIINNNFNSNVDTPAVSKPIQTQIVDMSGLVVVVIGWDKPYDKNAKSNDDYKILVYSLGDKKVYETLHPNNEEDPSNRKRRVQIEPKTLLRRTLTLKEPSAATSCMYLCNMSYTYYKAYVLLNGVEFVHTFSTRSLINGNYVNVLVSYLVCGQWSKESSENMQFSNMNGCALHIIEKYKIAVSTQTQIQQVLEYKI
ncbi:hypothetical protein F-liban_212 [Faustovirus]|nr:hypothetical protein F-liban_212 [Faustovirus]